MYRETVIASLNQNGGYEENYETFQDIEIPRQELNRDLQDTRRSNHSTAMFGYIHSRL
jgi:hypothetical protein